MILSSVFQNLSQLSLDGALVAKTLEVLDRAHQLSPRADMTRKRLAHSIYHPRMIPLVYTLFEEFHPQKNSMSERTKLSVEFIHSVHKSLEMFERRHGHSLYPLAENYKPTSFIDSLLNEETLQIFNWIETKVGELVNHGYGPLERITEGYILDPNGLDDFAKEVYELFRYPEHHSFPLGIEESREINLQRIKDSKSVFLPGNTVFLAQLLLGAYNCIDFTSTNIRKDLLNVYKFHASGVTKGPPTYLYDDGVFLHSFPNLTRFVHTFDTPLEEVTYYESPEGDHHVLVESEHFCNEYIERAGEEAIRVMNSPEKAVVIIDGFTPLEMPRLRELIRKHEVDSTFLPSAQKKTGLSTGVLARIYFGGGKVEPLEEKTHTKLFPGVRDGEKIMAKVHKSKQTTFFGNGTLNEYRVSRLDHFGNGKLNGPAKLEKFLPGGPSWGAEHIGDLVLTTLYDISDTPEAKQEPNCEALIEGYATLHAHMLLNFSFYAPRSEYKQQPTFGQIVKGLEARQYAIAFDEVHSLGEDYFTGVLLSEGRHILCYDLVKNNIGNRIIDFEEVSFTSYAYFFGGFFLNLGITSEEEMLRAIQIYKETYSDELSSKGVEPETYIGDDSFLGGLSNVLEQVPYTMTQLQLKYLAFGEKIQGTPYVDKFIDNLGIKAT